jgi:hypothetical protein
VGGGIVGGGLQVSPHSLPCLAVHLILMKSALHAASSVCPAAAAAPSRKRSRMQEISWHSLNPKP